MKIALFGTGNVAQTLLKYPLHNDCELALVCDNDSSKWGDSFCDYTVSDPLYILTINPDIILIANAKHTYAIYQQLIDMGISPDRIQFPYGWDFLEYLASPLDNFFKVTKKPLVPFRKGAAEIYRKYYGETAKSYNRRMREGFFDKYCKGEGLDIGYGADPLLPNISGWDLKNGDAQYLQGIEDESFDFVYSSHCLEHMIDVRTALKNWFRVVRHGGYLIVAVPHRDLYEKKLSLPSRWNFDHRHMFLLGESEAPDTLDVLEEIHRSLTDYKIEYAKICDEGHTITDPLIHSDGEYQIEIVLQKM